MKTGERETWRNVPFSILVKAIINSSDSTRKELADNVRALI